MNRGKKLPGHMGNEWRTGFNLKILRINTKYNVLYVKVRFRPILPNLFMFSVTYTLTRALETH